MTLNTVNITIEEYDNLRKFKSLLIETESITMYDGANVWDSTGIVSNNKLIKDGVKAVNSLKKEIYELKIEIYELEKEIYELKNPKIKTVSILNILFWRFKK